MNAWRILCLCVVTWLATWPAVGHAAHKALVIANQAYPSDPLVTPKADAALIASKLREAGFTTVTTKNDLSKSQLRSAVNSFASSLAHGDVAFFYYAGHGFEIDGRNYLIPTDFAAENQYEAQDDGYPLDTLLGILESKGASVTIAVFDACRTAPTLTRGWGRTATGGVRGFAAVASTPRAMYLAFSASTGQEAADRVSGSNNSPFAAALGRHLTAPGMDIDRVFRRVRNDVHGATSGRQQPMTTHNLTQDQFSLVPGDSGGGWEDEGSAQIPVQHDDGIDETAQRPAIDWVRIPSGSFEMGHADGADEEKPVHRVTISSFQMSRTEVTVAQYRLCVEAGACTTMGMEKHDGCNWGKAGRDDYPINCVDRFQARDFVSWIDGRLPSEAEWEYAARAGTTGLYFWGDTSDAGVLEYRAWYVKNGEFDTHLVGKKSANPWGLRDICGNVTEWVEDSYNDSYQGAPTDGSAWYSSSLYGVYRGGHYYDDAWALRLSKRQKVISHRRSGGIPSMGFRVAK